MKKIILTIVILAILILVIFQILDRRKGETNTMTSIQISVSTLSGIMIQDPLNRIIKYIPNGTDSYSEIPNSSYWTDEIIDPEYEEGQNNSGTGFVNIPNPVDGVYSISVSSSKGDTYTLEIVSDDIKLPLLFKSTSIDNEDNYSLTVVGGRPISLDQK